MTRRFPLWLDPDTEARLLAAADKGIPWAVSMLAELTNSQAMLDSMRHEQAARDGGMDDDTVALLRMGGLL